MELADNTYYTNSIVTDIKLPHDLVDTNELGKLKLEHEIEKGIFIFGKTYCFYNKGEFISKTKGVSSKNLTYEYYVY